MSHPACVTFNSDWKQLKYIDAYSNNTELFTNKLPLSTSSMVSSGFWEDSESLNRSETDPGQLIGSGMIVHNQSAHLSLRSSGNDDLINRNLDECTQVDKSLRASRRSMNDCADAKNKEIAPKDYAILKHLNVSSTCPNIQQAVHGDPSTMNTVLIKSHQLGTSPVTLPEKDYCNGVSTKFNHQYWKITTDWSDCDSDEPPHKRTNIPSTSRVSNKFCSSQDSSDSEYEDDNIVDQQGREDEQQTRNDCNQNSSTVPRTRFETALRRARLAAQQRAELNVLQNVSVSGGIMPNWGSPIKIKSLREVIPLPSLLQHHQLRQHTSARDDDGLTVTPVKKSISPTKDNLDKSLTVNKHNHTRSNSPDSFPENDLCAGIETWLNSRPSWINRSQKTSNQALQLCFLSNSEQDLVSSMRTTESVEHLNEKSKLAVDENNGELQDNGPVAQLPTGNDVAGDEDDDFVDSCNTSQLTVHSQMRQEKVRLERSLSLDSNSTKGQLFRENSAYEDVKQRMSEVDRFCDLYLEQKLQSCTDKKTSELCAQRLQQQRKLQADAELSLAQLPKIAHMQAQIEQFQWFVPSQSVAETLHITPKSRTFLSVKRLEQFSTSQLQLIANDLYEVIENLGRVLIQELTERDELHLEQGAKCVELDDLAAYFKELCIRASIRQFRRQVLGYHPSTEPNSLVSPAYHKTDSSVAPPNLNSMMWTRQQSYSPPKSSNASVSNFKQRVINSFLGRRATIARIS
ncbi:hypothetical protein EG68_00029 [Paragonimus skrjabini miyazakii]|uniref:Schwannomin interacting protein 1 C-terminal domain-containing protein n=1 Tax=Paragonimus skrjabini miyazakii TaxID=59628 RepID=A0A8S9Z711_9TREM|nr:hypothetical protein EG68_00029 [Paragonimus skrjabini miyazakii]